MALRVISYDGASYRDQMNRDEKGKPRECYPVVTIVLYFGYERRWNKPLNLKECFSIPKELEPFVNDYHVNLFEIAWLPDETVSMFQSDFRFVADYFSQKRKNQQYKAPAGEMKHVRAVLELLSAVMQDTRFIDAYNGRVAEGRPTNMDPWLDEIENRGIEKGRIKTVINTLTRYIRRQLLILYNKSWHPFLKDFMYNQEEREVTTNGKKSTHLRP